MNKVELLAPAGNLEKAKISLLYGADAVYIGGKKFSLRARASNFTIEDINELCSFAHSLNKKVYVTMNIIPHDEDFNDLETYLIDLSNAGVNAIITSSLTIINTCKRVAPNIECHISTQMSICNSSAVEYWKNIGATRVVLAREKTIDEIEYIKKNSELELEVFIHGGMCASYSGRCVLSNHMTDRDANRGGCAHSCRWNYNLFNNGEKINPDGTYYNIGSKDLMAIRFIPKLIDLGVASLKIEGRMKSPYYLACVVKCYRQLIDLYLEKKNITEEEFEYFEKEISRAENRETCCGFLNGIPTKNEQLYDTFDEKPMQEYVADVIDYNEDGTAVLVQRNYFEVGDTLEVFGPNLDNKTFVVDKMINAETLLEQDIANHPMEKFLVKIPFKVSKYDMVRKIK